MNTATRLLLFAFAMGLNAGPAHALTYQLMTTLDGAQAGVESPATGSGTLTYDDVSNLLTWDITYSGLLGTETVSHFHAPAAPGKVAPPVLTLALGSPKVGYATLSDAQERQLLGGLWYARHLHGSGSGSQQGQLLGGLWYVNVHSTLYPDGEIRGQIIAIPEPQTSVLFSAGLGLTALAARRRGRPNSTRRENGPL